MFGAHSVPAGTFPSGTTLRPPLPTRTRLPFGIFVLTPKAKNPPTPVPGSQACKLFPDLSAANKASFAWPSPGELSVRHAPRSKLALPPTRLRPHPAWGTGPGGLAWHPGAPRPVSRPAHGPRAPPPPGDSGRTREYPAVAQDCSPLPTPPPCAPALPQRPAPPVNSSQPRTRKRRCSVTRL